MAERTSLGKLIATVEDLKAQGKTVVQTHGVFDLIHPGIISHLEQSKARGDVLVVTIIRDKDVRRGPGRPIFNEQQRLDSVLSLSIVDYACIVDDETPFDCVKRIRPSVFSRGQRHRERDAGIHDKIFHEEREFYFGKAELMETGGMCFSSSGIINTVMNVYSPETKAFLKDFSEKYSFTDICASLGKLSSLKVLLIGDTIIDEYHYCHPRGKSAKSPIVVNKYISHEVFAGGVAAIANHMAGLCAEVKLVTLLGEENPHDEFLKQNLKPNVSPHFFYRADSPTVVKKRYINPNHNQKLFEINYLNDSALEGNLEDAIASYVEDVADDYDLVIVSDFGHGLLTKKLVSAVKNSAKVLAVNTQTNGANAGFNLITKYDRPAFVCLDETEARLALQEKHAAIEDVIARLYRSVSPDGLIITLGKRGSIGMGPESCTAWTPIFSSNTVDTVGAGDAYFSYASLCFVAGMPIDLISFIGNAVGALAVQIVGNKSSVEKELLEFINILMRIDSPSIP